MGSWWHEAFPLEIGALPLLALVALAYFIGQWWNERQDNRMREKMKERALKVLTERIRQRKERGDA